MYNIYKKNGDGDLQKLKLLWKTKIINKAWKKKAEEKAKKLLDIWNSAAKPIWLHCVFHQNSNIIKKNKIKLVMWQMSHVNWLTFYFVGINLIFDIFLIFSDLTTSIPKNHMKTDKHIKQIQNWQKCIKNTIYVEFKLNLHFRKLFWTSKTGPSSDLIIILHVYWEEKGFLEPKAAQFDFS